MIRISGPFTTQIMQTLFNTQLIPRQASYRSFRDQNGEVIDQGIALFFAAPHSFTGEDVLELQGHGGTVVIDLLLETIQSLGARMARPGEFSERAFLNDRIDLSQAEAIADLIDSASAQAARSAMRTLQGEFSSQVQTLIETLIAIRVFLEGALDFPEEEIDFLQDSDIQQRMQCLDDDLLSLIRQASFGQVLNDGISVVIAGKPNVGKSSLLNRLAHQDRAIVSSTPGTTRDIIEESISLGGLLLKITDTAGLRVTGDEIEREGIRRASLAANKADVLLLMREVGDQDCEEEALLLADLESHTQIVHLYNKIDLHQCEASSGTQDGVAYVNFSAKNGEGLELLEETLKKIAGYSNSSESNFIARRRHLSALKSAQCLIARAVQDINLTGSAELAAENLREAQQELAQISGRFTSEDLLGEIFSSFCIGK